MSHPVYQKLYHFSVSYQPPLVSMDTSKKKKLRKTLVCRKEEVMFLSRRESRDARQTTGFSFYSFSPHFCLLLVSHQTPHPLQGAEASHLLLLSCCPRLLLEEGAN